jgi:hypothetical protein
MKTKELFGCFALMIGMVTTSQAQGWRGIVPLHSTRQDVEKIIGQPTESNGITYDLQSERVSICRERQSSRQLPQ